MSEVQTAVAVAAVVRKVLTRDEKIEQFESKAAEFLSKANELREEARKEEALRSVGAGTEVSFEVGRAETRRTVSGNVLAAYDIDGKRKVKVLVGEGADAELFEVEVSKLLAAKLEEAEPVVTEAVDELAGIN